jgi:tRNA modification GTPase
VRTKADLESVNAARDDAFSYVSAETGQGLVALLARIDALVAIDGALPGDDVVVTRERHLRGLRDAISEVQAFVDGWTSGALPATVAAVHLHSARDALSSLVGAIGTEDILDRVFADFCIGK